MLQIFKDIGELTPPDARCLSPAGQYNLRLGVMKVIIAKQSKAGIPLTHQISRLQELSPKFVATYTDNPSSFEGHPFIVEAAVSLGGAEVKDFPNCLRGLRQGC